MQIGLQYNSTFIFYLSLAKKKNKYKLFHVKHK